MARIDKFKSANRNVAYKQKRQVQNLEDYKYINMYIGIFLLSMFPIASDLYSLNKRELIC